MVDWTFAAFRIFRYHYFLASFCELFPILYDVSVYADKFKIIEKISNGVRAVRSRGK